MSLLRKIRQGIMDHLRKNCQILIGNADRKRAFRGGKLVSAQEIIINCSTHCDLGVARENGRIVDSAGQQHTLPYNGRCEADIISGIDVKNIKPRLAEQFKPIHHISANVKDYFFL